MLSLSRNHANLFKIMRKISNNELGRLTPEQFSACEKLPVVVVLDNVRSLNNVGSFFRTCDAFALEAIFLCGITATPPSREIHKTALGAELTVAWRYFEHTADALKELRSGGYQLWAVEQVEGAISLETLRVERDVKLAVVFGNEVDGVSQEAVDACQGAIEIPQRGTKHSLNVSVCAGVVLWELFAQLCTLAKKG